MWQQLLSMPGCRAIGGSGPTALHFPSELRADWSPEERVAELERWASGLDQVALTGPVLESTAADAAELELSYRALEDEARAAHAYSAELRHWLEEATRAAEAGAEAQRALRKMQASATWRLRSRLLALPRPLRAVARALAGRAAPRGAGSRHPVATPVPSSTATESPAPDRPSGSPARPPGPSTR